MASIRAFKFHEIWNSELGESVFVWLSMTTEFQFLFPFKSNNWISFHEEWSNKYSKASCWFLYVFSLETGSNPAPQIQIYVYRWKRKYTPFFPRPKPFERRTENRTFVRIHSDKWCYYPEFGSKSVFHSHFRCCMLLALEFIAVDVNRDNNTTLSMRMMTTAIASVMSEQIGYLMLIQRKCLLKNEIESSKYWRNKQRFQ